MFAIDESPSPGSATRRVLRGAPRHNPLDAMRVRSTQLLEVTRGMSTNTFSSYHTQSSQSLQWSGHQLSVASSLEPEEAALPTPSPLRVDVSSQKGVAFDMYKPSEHLPRSTPSRGCCHYLINLFAKPDDDKRMVALKSFLFRFAMVTGAVTCFGPVYYREQFTESLLYIVSVLNIAIVCATMLLMLIFDSVNDTTLSILIVESAILVLVIDLSTVEHVGYPEYWPLFLALFSLNFVFQVPERTQILSYCIAGLSFLLSLGHKVFRFDIDPLSNNTDFLVHVCDCDTPPCPIPIGNNVLSTVGALSTLFFVTNIQRGFVNRLRAQQRKLVAAIEVAESIAVCLSAFDLAAAEGLLAGNGVDGDSDLPPKLRSALEHILANLRQYRPYLPDELFSELPHDTETLSTVKPDAGVPGALCGEAAIVFTDIRQSTALWEESGNTMREALTTHNKIIRNAIAVWHGYEVKTIGDAFMVAFHTAGEAVEFGVQVQREIEEATWPPGLARPNSDDGFSLLSVRIGVNFGPVSVERNTLAGRYDYFGPTVNAAARVEAHGIPGAVTVTEAVAGNAGAARAIEASMKIMPFAQARHGKGLAKPLWLSAVVGEGAPAARVELIEQLAAEGQAPVVQPVSPCSADHDEAGLRARAASPSLASSMQSRTPSSETSSVYSRRLLRINSLWYRNVCEAATVGVVKCSFWCDEDPPAWNVAEELLASNLQQLHTHLKATGGHLSTLMHNVVLLSWGVYGRCSQHMNESVRFLMLLDEGFQAPRHAAAAEDERRYHAGLATGPVASGQISMSSSQRLLTMLGPCVELGLMLCSGAAELGAAALVASVAGVRMDRHEGSSMLRDHLRFVDSWDLAPSKGEVGVYELLIASLRASLESKAYAGGGGFAAADKTGDRACVDDIDTSSPLSPRPQLARLPHALGKWATVPSVLVRTCGNQ